MYKRLGCFKQLIGNDSTNPFPEPQVLFNETLESRTKYSEWDVYLPTLICRCAKKAMEAKFTHFAVSDLGLCLSGNEISEYYDKVRKEKVFIIILWSSQSWNFSLQTFTEESGNACF